MGLSRTAVPSKARGLYAFAQLSGIDCGLFRFRAAGLANNLFPWARCVSASERFGLRRIASTWPQFSHDWIYLGRDKRSHIGLFDERRTAICGVRKILTRACQEAIPEDAFLADPGRFSTGLVLFSGMQGFFSPFLEDHRLVKDSLVRITRVRHIRRVAPDRGIAVHIRLGDFLTPGSEPDARLPNRRQPMGWYHHVIRELRAIAPDVPILVFSDGSDAELRELLSLPGLQRVRYGSPIADLLALSSASVLVASNSTYSGWAAFLGRMPVIWPRSDCFQSFHPEHPEFEPQVGYGPLPEQTAALIRSRFASQARCCDATAGGGR